MTNDLAIAKSISKIHACTPTEPFSPRAKGTWLPGQYDYDRDRWGLWIKIEEAPGHGARLDDLAAMELADSCATDRLTVFLCKCNTLLSEGRVLRICNPNHATVWTGRTLAGSLYIPVSTNAVVSRDDRSRG